jgi:hypothetical protein
MSVGMLESIVVAAERGASVAESEKCADADTRWDFPGPENNVERRLRQRREYHQRRNLRTSGGQEHGRQWTIAAARIALDIRRTVPDAAIELGRSASAVESLRRRWRNGRLPAGLIDQVPRPPRPDGDTAPQASLHPDE